MSKFKAILEVIIQVIKITIEIYIPTYEILFAIKTDLNLFLFSNLISL